MRAASFLPRLAATILLAVLLSACSSMQKPTGVGSGTDELKRSPCADKSAGMLPPARLACVEVPQHWPAGPLRS